MVGDRAAARLGAPTALSRIAAHGMALPAFVGTTARRATPPALTSTTVHVWRVALDQGAATVNRLAALLSADERERAARYHFERDRQRFVVARGVLRLLLGCYCGLPPRELAFVYGPQGKPALAPSLAGELQFNVSHSDGLALCAVTHGRAVGVDVERVRLLPDAEQIAAHYFSPRESAALRALQPDQRVAGFFNCWTRKEAYIKATGAGLTQPLDSFDVSLAPGEPARLHRVAGAPGEVTRWRFQLPAVPAGYAAALAVEGDGWALQCGDWLAD